MQRFPLLPTSLQYSFVQCLKSMVLSAVFYRVVQIFKLDVDGIYLVCKLLVSIKD